MAAKKETAIENWKQTVTAAAVVFAVASGIFWMGKENVFGSGKTNHNSHRAYIPHMTY